MSTAIKAIVFDLGNVLVDFDHMLASKKLASFSTKSAEEIYDLFFDSVLISEFEEGRLNPEEFFLRVKDEIGLKIGYEEFLPIWEDIFFVTDKNKQTHQIAAFLKKRFSVNLLSNINVLHYLYLKSKFDIFNIFDKVFLSYELNLRKPNPLIYQRILRVIGRSAQEVFYTDDRPDLVESARIQGIQAFTFKGADSLKKDLESVGIIIAQP